MSEVISEKRGTVCWIEFNRPDSFNAFISTMIKSLIETLSSAAKDSDIRSIVLTGRGRAFQVGQDLSEIGENTRPDDYRTMLETRYHPLLQTMLNFNKPIVAAINGATAGAGMALALAADFRVMREDAYMTSAFMNIALVPDTGLFYLLNHLVGAGKTLEIIALSPRIDAEKALELGLVHRIFAEEHFERETEHFAEQLAMLPTKVFGMSKRLWRHAQDLTLDRFLVYEAEMQAAAAATEDHRQGIEAFRAKKKPIFSGR